MYFDSFQAFLDMGGHGFYVWTSYGLALALFVYNVAVPVLSKKAFMQEQRRLLKRKLQSKQHMQSTQRLQSPQEK